MGGLLRKSVTLSFLCTTMQEVNKIAAENGLEEKDTIRLLVRLGIRAYRQGRGLFCGFKNCTRANCCGEIKKIRREAPNPAGLRLVDLAPDDEP